MSKIKIQKKPPVRGKTITSTVDTFPHNVENCDLKTEIGLHIMYHTTLISLSKTHIRHKQSC